MAVATITIDQEFDVTLRITDRAGHPAQVDGVPVWTSNPPNGLELVPSADGMSCVVRSTDVVDEGIVLTVEADADLGAGVEPLIGLLTVAVTSGSARILALNAGTPRMKQTAAPSPSPARTGKRRAAVGGDDGGNEDGAA